MKFFSSDDNIRLDKLVHEKFPNLSRSLISKMCDKGEVFVNSKIQPSKYKIKNGDKIEVKFDLKKLNEVPEIELPVIFENKDVIVIDKPSGILTHSKGAFNSEPTVASFISRKVRIPKNAKQLNAREGIVHRLDRDTSGVIICAKTIDAEKRLKKQFEERKVQKTYIAVVEGYLLPKQAIIDKPIARNVNKPKTFKVSKNGKSAQTTYKVVKELTDKSVVELHPKTGRTHQLRVHLASVGHPILGDRLYSRDSKGRLMLHAKDLELDLPDGEHKKFTSKLPTEFEL